MPKGRPKKGGRVVTTNVRVTTKAHRLLKILAVLRDKDMSVVLEDFIAQNAPDVVAAYEAAEERGKEKNKVASQN